jgi:PAS domain S-box-containing protein
MKENPRSSKYILDDKKVEYTQLFNNDHAVMLLIDPESLNIINANNAASNYYGWSCEELRQKKISQIDILSEEKMKAELSKAKKGIKNHFTFKHQLRNHEIRDVEICAIPINTEEKTLLCFIVRDITETKKVEEESLLTDESAEKDLVYREKKYQGIFENAINGVAVHRIILDEAGNPIDYFFLEANEAFEKYTGLKVTDVIGKRVTEILPGIEGTSLIETYGNVVLTGVPVNFETFTSQLNKYYSVNAYKIDNDCFAAIFQDITERKQAEKTILFREEQYRTLFTEAPISIIIHDKESGEIIDANPKTCEMYGFSSLEQLKANNFWLNPSYFLRLFIIFWSPDFLSKS